MPDDTLLTWNTGVTVSQLKGWIAAADRNAIADFLRDRFAERYFTPVKTTTNGFLVMAVSCLVIEALESFRHGWASSDRVSQQAFADFFSHYNRFQEFRSPVAHQFYKHIRCGILHQGETTGGWTLTRKSPELLLDVAHSRVNATKFHEELSCCLEEYISDLKAAAITDELWTNCLTKLYATIHNCD